MKLPFQSIQITEDGNWERGGQRSEVSFACQLGGHGWHFEVN